MVWLWTDCHFLVMVFKALFANCFTVITFLLIVSRLLCSLCSSSWLVLIPHGVAFYNTRGKLTGEPSIRLSTTRSVRVGISEEMSEGSCTCVYKCVCIFQKRIEATDIWSWMQNLTFSHSSLGKSWWWVWAGLWLTFWIAFMSELQQGIWCNFSSCWVKAMFYPT